MRGHSWVHTYLSPTTPRDICGDSHMLWGITYTIIYINRTYRLNLDGECASPSTQIYVVIMIPPTVVPWACWKREIGDFHKYVGRDLKKWLLSS